MPPKRKAAAAVVAAVIESDVSEGGEGGDSDGFVPEESESEDSQPEMEVEVDGGKNVKPKGKATKKKAPKAAKENGDGEGEGEEKKKPAAKRKPVKKEPEEDDEPRVRAPEFNSSYVPIPFKGRIGYACLNTYLRTSVPPVFCSRTCRIETILKQGEWTTAGLPFVQSLALQNAKDLSTLIRWNEKYKIRFLRISSEMFPFASHAKYGYNLDFARETLGEAGKLAMKFGHRLTTHPGQFTQLGSPRPEVIKASKKDLEYHSQLLSGLGMEGQADKDAVMILHMGGMFGDKGETLDRFRKNYAGLSEDVKARLVLENDDVIWSVHDLLPICEELNIPLVLDYHHNNIIHDESMRAGTEDIQQFFPRIKATWTRKGITQKQHYSEPCEGSVTGREMRKHSPRVLNLPPCDDTMDLMIEAKDKEQAVFELYRRYGIEDGGGAKEVAPHERSDDNRPPKKGEAEREEVPEEELGMGGPEGRVYWPLGKEEWLTPRKRVLKKKEVEDLEDGAPVKSTRGKKVKKEENHDKEAMKEEDNGEEAPEPMPTKKARRKNGVKKEDDGEEAPEPMPAKKARRKNGVKKEIDGEQQSTAPPPAKKSKRAAGPSKSITSTSTLITLPYTNEKPRRGRSAKEIVHPPPPTSLMDPESSGLSDLDIMDTEDVAVVVGEEGDV
ncbi:UV-endonuclease UvdE-domain-containing protein [Tricharina praecox]|uniref:UV-endonuclease UvdE-domain-containing protein n=1 Tax=Tricharina praecox TaxID=43433 RepID=UPI00221EC845|nr:UV-endonuclease UvdE-domain-containing protein [Tricharina praecox]KAI5858047.1 UV-endonuclease UvdE-domain-containing protein [Tricharina praecox]